MTILAGLQFLQKGCNGVGKRDTKHLREEGAFQGFSGAFQVFFSLFSRFLQCFRST